MPKESQFQKLIYFLNMNIFTKKNRNILGVFCLDGGTLDHRYYESFIEMKNYVNQIYLMNKS